MATATIPFPQIRRKPARARKLASKKRPQLASASRGGFPDVYFVKRIDNSRVRRELNPERRRQCFTLLGLCSLVFICGLMLAWQHFQCVRTGYGIEQLKAQRSSLAEWNRELRLEQASLADPQRIDTLARAKLGLATPTARQVIRLGAAGEPAEATMATRDQASSETPRGR
jgi:cell division protein FtsL